MVMVQCGRGAAGAGVRVMMWWDGRAGGGWCGRPCDRGSAAGVTVTAGGQSRRMCDAAARVGYATGTCLQHGGQLQLELLAANGFEGGLCAFSIGTLSLGRGCENRLRTGNKCTGIVWLMVWRLLVDREMDIDRNGRAGREKG